jgi:hypothetical protein
VQSCLMAVLISGLPVGAYAQTAADTARLAAASSYLETGGLKIGMSLKDLGPATRALNPLLKLTNTEKVTVWPPDRVDSGKAAPPNSPQSIQTLQLQTIQGARPTMIESVVATLALYPNMPVVTRLNRVITYPDGAGPNYAQVIGAIRAKYGPATETQVQADSVSLKILQISWHFDKNDKLLPPGTQVSYRACDWDQAINACKDRSILMLNITATGTGILKSLQYDLVGGPLVVSADLATDAYLQSVEDARTRQQTNDSKNRPMPKL